MQSLAISLEDAGVREHLQDMIYTMLEVLRHELQKSICTKASSIHIWMALLAITCAATRHSPTDALPNVQYALGQIFACESIDKSNKYARSLEHRLSEGL
jgi:hypothetical protein